HSTVRSPRREKPAGLHFEKRLEIEFALLLPRPAPPQGGVQQSDLYALGTNSNPLFFHCYLVNPVIDSINLTLFGRGGYMLRRSVTIAAAICLFSVAAWAQR